MIKIGMSKSWGSSQQSVIPFALRTPANAVLAVVGSVPACLAENFLPIDCPKLHGPRRQQQKWGQNSQPSTDPHQLPHHAKGPSSFCTQSNFSSVWGWQSRLAFMPENPTRRAKCFLFPTPRQDTPTSIFSPHQSDSKETTRRGIEPLRLGRQIPIRDALGSPEPSPR